MKKSKIMPIFVLLVFCIINSVSIAAEVNFNGFVGVGIQQTHSRLEGLLPSTAKMGSELEIRMNWFLDPNANLHMQLNHYWDYNLKAKNTDYYSKVQRLFLDYSFLPGTNIRVGRQRIAWGKGLYSSPTDFFNPEQVLIQTENMDQGISAVTLQNFQSENTWTLVWVPPLEASTHALGFKMERVTFDYDIAVNGFYNQDYIALGLNGARSFFGLNFYSSLAILRHEEETNWKGLLGGNYLVNMNNNWIMHMELLTEPTWERERKYEISLGGSVSPIDKLSCSLGLKYNIEDQSSMWMTSADYLIRDDLTVELEGFMTIGDIESEYGSFPMESQINVMIKQYF